MGREFIDLFNEWSETYDDTVVGHDIEYREVFRNYNEILNITASKAQGYVVEFGVGTGNLTEKLLQSGCRVTGIEPSPSMREIAEVKLGGRAEVKDGDFLEFEVLGQVDSFVSTYAFHHLTDEEKERAIKLYASFLEKGGKIIFADTIYESVEAYEKAIADAEHAGYVKLATDLRREYYTTIPFLEKALTSNGFLVTFEKCNGFVWILEAIKQ
ncbi:class I SAM-dependent DNA methyltransferase [Peribacillus deserti]|uniref:Uncharacterized methyltransferase CUU66_04980 n=1 Tax=Peribacillus deserti TaxID=673318 RepID=A0A2N5M979_9BACI|nr:class I SAM-dependent methyltransferase [Peribacillus deserti]PLT30908.1 SAM-dependent methyltransferase [Peribacillus deserti]